MEKSVAIITRYFTFQNSPSILSETPSFTATNSHNSGGNWPPPQGGTIRSRVKRKVSGQRQGPKRFWASEGKTSETLATSAGHTGDGVEETPRRQREGSRSYRSLPSTPGPHPRGEPQSRSGLRSLPAGFCCSFLGESSTALRGSLPGHAAAGTRALTLTSPTAFTTGKCRRPIVLNRLKTWETWVLGETVKGAGFMYGVTSCRGDNTGDLWPVLPGQDQMPTVQTSSGPRRTGPRPPCLAPSPREARLTTIMRGFSRVRSRSWMSGYRG